MKTDIKTINEQLKQLDTLLKETRCLTFNVELNDDFNKLFHHIHELSKYFDDIKDSNKNIPEIHTAEILFEANGNDDDLADMQSHLDTEYPEFINDCSKEELNVTPIDKTQNNYKYHLYGFWIGNTDDLAKLTHHAEAFYDENNFENVHVEVCIDDEWFGRPE